MHQWPENVEKLVQYLGKHTERAFFIVLDFLFSLFVYYFSSKYCKVLFRIDIAAVWEFFLPINPEVCVYISAPHLRVHFFGENPNPDS